MPPESNLAPVIELDAHRTVWSVGDVQCTACGAAAVSTYDSRADTDHLECPKCGRFSMRVTRVHEFT